MSDCMLPLLFIIVGVALVFTALAWQSDYEVNEGPTSANCAATMTLLIIAIVVLLWLVHLMAPFREGK
jgi:hypothetical protein